jgi:hypothetical protein
MSYTGPGVLQADSNAISVTIAATPIQRGDGLKTAAWASISISKVQPINIALRSDAVLNIEGQNQMLRNLPNNETQGFLCSC